MFLEKNILNDIPNPSEMLEILYESDALINELTIDIIKKEHNAIILGESIDILEEDFHDWVRRAKETLTNAYQKFLLFIDNVINKWTTLQAEIQVKILDRTKLKRLMNAVGNNIRLKTDKVDKLKAKGRPETMINISNSMDAFLLGFQNFLNALRSAGSILTDALMYTLKDAFIDNAAVKSIFLIVKAENVEESETFTITERHILAASNFLDKRKRGILYLKMAKEVSKAIYNNGIRKLSSDEKDEKKALISQSTFVQRCITKFITAINKCTGLAVKICNKANSAVEEIH